MAPYRAFLLRTTSSIDQRTLPCQPGPSYGRELNEGFEATTHFDSKNRETRKTSWADSRFDNEYVADDDQTRRFLREHLYELNTAGLE
jgi:hypothetical protein